MLKTQIADLQPDINKRMVSEMRRKRDQNTRQVFLLMSILPLLLALVMLVALIFRSAPILSTGSLVELLLGKIWKPGQGLFGFSPFIMGTIWVTGAAMVIAVPPCLLAAVYLAEYAGKTTKTLMKPLLDMLTAIPSVVYGVWGMLTIVPWVQGTVKPLFGRWFEGFPFFVSDNPTGFSIFSGSLVLAVMVAPFMISVIFEVLHTVPDDLRHASLALGATRWQTIRKVVLPLILPGIVAAIVLGCSRALGETMAVMMVVGNVAKIPGSIFDAAYPLPALIANNYGEMLSIPMYDAALMGASLVLLVMVLVFNITANLVLRQILRRINS